MKNSEGDLSAKPMCFEETAAGKQEPDQVPGERVQVGEWRIADLYGLEMKSVLQNP